MVGNVLQAVVLIVLMAVPDVAAVVLVNAIQIAVILVLVLVPPDVEDVMILVPADA